MLYFPLLTALETLGGGGLLGQDECQELQQPFWGHEEAKGPCTGAKYHL